MSKTGKQILVVRLLLLALVVCGATPMFADAGDPPGRVARLGSIQGTVSVQPTGVDQWSQAEANYPVATGDRLYADQNGRDELSIGGTVVRMSHSTDLTMTNLSDQLTQLGLAQGTIRVRTFGLDSNQQVEIDTPNGAITVMQPGDIRIDSYDSNGGTQVTVNSGSVQVTGPNLSQNIGQGESVRLVGTNPIEMQQIDTPGLDEFDQWCIQRDHHMQNARSAQYVSRSTPGYDDLDDYGSWSTGTEYGPVWYPNNVAADWAPYREGHWVWTGPWGWTWVDSEPWGYAPFHYGRWAYMDDRWGWVPGPVAVVPIWSPALVAFVGGGGFSIGIGTAAWFPLGVGEPYIPWYHCSPRYEREVNVTNINITNVHNTTIVNNYNNFVNNPAGYRSIEHLSFNSVNQQRGITAVNARAFASGQPVVRNITRISPEQLRNAQVIAHPSIQPTRQALVPRPVTHPMPVAVQRPTLLTRGGREALAVPGAKAQPVPFHALPPTAARGGQPTLNNRPGGQPTVNRPGVQPTVRTIQPADRAGAQPGNPASQRPNAPGETGLNGGHPLITRNGTTTLPGRPAMEPNPAPQRNAPPTLNNARPAGPNTGMQRPGDASGSRPGVATPTAPRPGTPAQGYGRPPVSPSRPVYQSRPLVTRNEPPGNQIPFHQQQRGLQHDPGRPLDPAQRENLSQGRPAGASQDREVLPHAQQVQRPQPQGNYSAPQGRPQGNFSAPQPRPQGNFSAPESRPQGNFSAPQMRQQSAPQPRMQQSAPPRMQQSEPHGGDNRHGR